LPPAKLRGQAKEGKKRSSARPTVKGFKVNRELPEGVFRFEEVFQGVHHAPPVVRLFGAPGARDVCSRTAVHVVNATHYMRVSDKDGSLLVNRTHLRTADETTLYLDVVHELVHIRQLRDGQDLFDPRYRYVDRPTELEAYQLTVTEARRLRLSEVELREYLRVEWITDSEFTDFLKALGVRATD
jgi:hypothetical protein